MTDFEPDLAALARKDILAGETPRRTYFSAASPLSSLSRS